MRNLLFALTLALSACASAPSSTDAASVTQTMNVFVDALNSLDADRIEELLAPDVTAFFPSSSPERVEGKEKVAAIFREYAGATRATKARTNIVPQDMIVATSGDLAVVSFQVRNPAVVSRRTFVLQRSGERWLITHLHASNIRLAE